MLCVDVLSPLIPGLIDGVSDVGVESAKASSSVHDLSAQRGFPLSPRGGSLHTKAASSAPVKVTCCLEVDNLGEGE